MSIHDASLLLTVVTAIVTAIPGVFVVLRRSAMLVDGIGHAVLPGIVAGFIITHNFSSPLLILGAALAGLLVVLGAEAIQRTGLVAGDAPQGLIYPALFAAGVLVISMGFGHIHFDIDMVMVGDVNLAAADQWIISTAAVAYSLGPRFLYVILGLGLINVVFILASYRQLKITTFDNAFARTTGLRSGLLNAVFMFIVSVTVTTVFEVMGAVLVISLVVAPAATAQLFAHRLSTMFALAILIAAAVGGGGFLVAYHWDAPTSAVLALSYGVVFLLALVGQRLMRQRNRRRLRQAHAGR